MIVALLWAGCGDHPASAIHPAGPAAAEIAWLTWVLTAVLSAVFVVTMGLAVAALVRRQRPDEPGELGTGFVVVSGIVVPAVILVGILALSLQTTLALRSQEGEVTVRIVGHQYWWEVVYPEAGVVDANHLVLPAGVPVRLELESADVIHSLWIPNLHGKMDLLPERTNLFWLAADAPGTWRGVCAEFCGDQHAKMAFSVAALAPREFDAWLATRAASAPAPEARGQEIFVERGCAACHPVRGVSAAELGPDLTHLGTRPTLGAGAVPNTRDDLRAWLRDPQRIKPGNRMPPTRMPDDELEALIDWLGSPK